jgi:hypothetical protein
MADEPLDLDALQQEWENTTEGLWATDIEPAYRSFEYEEPPFCRGVKAGDTHVVRFDDDYGTDQWADASWIASAHEVYPRLLQCIRELEERLAFYDYIADGDFTDTEIEAMKATRGL